MGAEAPILDAETARSLAQIRVTCEIKTVLGERDAERARQVAGPAAQVVPVDGAARRSPLRHQRDPVDWFERPDQDRGRMAVCLRDGVHETVDAIVQVDVSDARRPVQRRVALRRAGGGVTGRIVLTDVGLSFDDHAGGDTSRASVHEDHTEQFFRHDQCLAAEKAARQRVRREG